MRVLRDWAWPALMTGVAAFALVCCTVGPAIVIGALAATGVAMATGIGLIGLLVAAGGAVVVSSAALRHRRRCRETATSQTENGVGSCGS